MDFGNRALNIALQDGPMAGQSVPRKSPPSPNPALEKLLTPAHTQMYMCTSSREEQKISSH